MSIGQLSEQYLGFIWRLSRQGQLRKQQETEQE